MNKEECKKLAEASEVVETSMDENVSANPSAAVELATEEEKPRETETITAEIQRVLELHRTDDPQVRRLANGDPEFLQMQDSLAQLMQHLLPVIQAYESK